MVFISLLLGIFVVFAVLFLLHTFMKRKFGYWKERGVFYYRPSPFFGNISSVCLFKETLGECFKNFYDTTNEDFFGIFVLDQPALVIKSAELMKQILIRDFDHFTDRNIATPRHNEMMANMLLIQKSPEWKRARPKMTPMFSSGKLKGMFPIIDGVGEQLTKYIRNNLGILEARETFAKYTTDVIAKCAFGIDAYCFENDDAIFRKLGRCMFHFTWRNGIAQVAHFFSDRLVNTFKLNFFAKWTTDYLSQVVWETMKYREESKIRLNDLIDIFIDMRKDKKLCEEIKFEGDRVVAQAVQFFSAGFETTSSAISFTLYELCMHTEIQNKLRHEIISNVKKHGGVTYEGVLEMKYLDMCLMESLRKYPVLPFLDRRCNEDYTIPGTDTVIEKGIPIYFPMLGLHYDPKYFPEPEKFQPERFLDKALNKSNEIHYMPFGEGPRKCIGDRFALLTSKIALIHILQNFEVERTQETPIHVQYAARTFILQSKVGLPMKFRNISSVISQEKIQHNINNSKYE